MANYFVGQKVRKVKNRVGNPPDAAPWVTPIGAIGFVLVTRGSPFLQDGDECGVAWEDEPEPVSVAAYMIEPVYDGNEKVSWKSCAWQPTPEKVT